MLPKTLSTFLFCLLFLSLNAQIKYTKEDSSLIRACTELPPKFYPELDKTTGLLKLCLVLEYSPSLLLLQHKLHQSNNPTLYYTIGLIYFQHQQPQKAIEYLDHASKKGYHQALAITPLIYFQNNDYQKASELIQSFSAEEQNNIHCWTFFYLTAVETLINGDKNDAFKRLKAVHAQSPYKDYAEKLLQHFFPVPE